MSIEFVDYSRHKPLSNKQENEIREIFYERWEKTNKQVKAISDEINKWRSQSIRQIDTYADDQIRQLQTHYNRQRTSFDEKRNENLDTAKAFSKSKQNEPFNDLCKECRLMKFYVAQLEHIRVEIERPIVVSAEEWQRVKRQNQANACGDGYQGHGTGSIVGDAGMTMKSGANSSRSSFQSPSNERSDRLLNTPSPNTSPRSTTKNNTPKASVTNVDDSNNKCLICFMIYPLQMAIKDRHQHVSEHLVDGERANTTV